MCPINSYSKIIISGIAHILNYNFMTKIEETESLRDLAIDAYHKGDNNEAIKLFTKIINIGNPTSDILFRRGFCSYILNDFKSSIIDCSKAIELNGGAYYADSIYFRIRGSSKEHLRDFHGAIEDYSKAIENIGNSVSSKSEDNFYKNFYEEKTFLYLGRSRMFIEIKEYTKAHKDLLNALEIADNLKEKDEINKLIDELKPKIRSKKRGLQKSSNNKKTISKIPLVKIKEDSKNSDHTVSDKSLLEVIKELDNLTGLTTIKEEINRIITFAKFQIDREKFGLRKDNINNNFIFLGSPGTGKTEIARILGKILSTLGLLEKGHFVETDRSGLVGCYLGKTADKTLSKCYEALGGVLFIDEAYSLCAYQSEDEYGKEAISTLLKFMEDNKNNISVIVAGYTLEMESFLTSNPGLRSRFNTTFKFSDYKDRELYEIVLHMLNERERKIKNESENTLKDLICNISCNKKSTFGNARSMRNLVETLIKRQSYRLINKNSITKEDCLVLTKEDFTLTENQIKNL